MHDDINTEAYFEYNHYAFLLNKIKENHSIIHSEVLTRTRTLTKQNDNSRRVISSNTLRTLKNIT